MATATSSSDASEGPVLNLINKRLRALRKKQNRINQMEESLSKGKALNKQQQDTLNSKQSILGAIEELDRLLLLVPCAVSEELQINKEIKNVEKISVKGNEEELRKEVVGNEETTKGFVGIEDVRKGFVRIEDVRKKFVGIEERLNGFVGNEDARKGLVGIEELLELVYFGSLFDVKTQSEFVGTMFRKIHERGCCLSYDCVTDDEEEGFRELLGEGDLDLISMLGGLLIERPVDSGLSHKNALERCVERAKLWVSNSEQPIVPHSDITYAALREKLNKIMASDYFTTTPKMMASVEMEAVAENFKSFHVPLNGSVVPINAPIEVEGSSIKDEHRGQDDGDSHKHEAFDGQFGHVEELHREASEVENGIEGKVEDRENLQQNQQNELQNLQEFDNKEQANAPRRQHRGGRIGGYKGYHNGRGGRGRGGYQNGHSQHYEQASKYYPRYNNNYRGRGGRGGAGENYYTSAEGGRIPFVS